MSDFTHDVGMAQERPDEAAIVAAEKGAPEGMCWGVKDLADVGLAITLMVIVLGCPLDAARAQSRGVRAMRSIEAKETETGWTFELAFDFPVRYLRHTPQAPGRVLRIEVAPVERGGDELPGESQRERLPVERGRSGPLIDVLYDGGGEQGALVELQFAQTLAFAVEQGRDLRSLRIRADLPAAKSTTEADARSSALLTRARHAIRDGELDLAIALLTRILEMPADSVPVEQRMEARELLGLTHERRGQSAHAAAEYEAYLAEYPEGPAAARVSQRLEALRTATAAPTQKLRPMAQGASRGGAGPGLDREVFGTLGERYYRSEARENDTGMNFVASDFLTDAAVTGRVGTDDWELRGDFAGTYDLSLQNTGRTNDVRISRMSTRYDDRIHGLEATFGRQRRSDGGVLGRFDGVNAAARFDRGIRVSALAGMPVQQWSDNSPDYHTWVFGGAVNFEDLLVEGFQGQLWVVGQRAYSMTDRTAVGGELRYANDETYSFVYFDYDFVFQTLNSILASTTWRASADTDLRASFERRNAPVVTLYSAMQGQNVNNLDELRKTLSNSDIRDLALDRTAVAYTGMLGATHRPTDRLQLSADFAVNHVSSTDTSAGVTGAQSNGPDFATTLQLVVSDWLIENGVGSVSVRYFEGQFYRSFMTLAYSRFRFMQSFTASPRLRLEWRNSKLQGERTRVRPSFELGWRRGPWMLYGEAGGEWEEPISGGERAAREFGYFVETGVRWNF